MSIGIDISAPRLMLHFQVRVELQVLPTAKGPSRFLTDSLYMRPHIAALSFSMREERYDLQTAVSLKQVPETLALVDGWLRLVHLDINLPLYI